MLTSMTGFGRVHKQFSNYSITVEMKSVNHRFCEVTIRIPRQMMLVEEKIKKIIHTYIQRGRVEVFVSIEGNVLSSKEIQVEWDLLDQYFQALDKARQRYELPGEGIKLADLFKHPEFTTIVEKEMSHPELEQDLLELVEQTVVQLKEMRLEEGKGLLVDITRNLESIQESCQQVEGLAPKVVTQYRERLYKKIAEYSEGLVDETRLLNEVAILADKIDINEELTRINSHLSQFYKTIDGEEQVVGRKLDFLVQELNREINTIGSKANDVHIAEQVVNMKTKLEKIKEQVQNIE
ncbi:YicC/YloC family endoribonuclease [Bacillus sp. AK128]